MACPHAAAVAAMWISATMDITDLTPLQVIYLLLGSANDLGSPGRDTYYGFGRLDMFPWLD